MIPSTTAQLEDLRCKCRALVKKRAYVSAVASAVPIPAIDILADIVILLNLIPTINQAFGLTPKQIHGYDLEKQDVIIQAIEKTGSSLIGVNVTNAVVTRLLKTIVGRIITKQILKFVPFIGWLINVGIGYAAMKYLGQAHINDCYQVCQQTLAMTK